MSYQVVRSFILKTDGTRNEIILNIPLNLNPNREYFMKLMSFRFQNVFCNFVGDIIASPNGSWSFTYNGVDYTLLEKRYLTPAIGDITVLLSWLKNMIVKVSNCGEDEVNININNYGKIEYIFSTNFTNINLVGGCLSTTYFGYTNSITSNETISSLMPVISQFNSILLSCSLVGNSCFVQDNNGNLSNTSVICSVNAALDAFENVDYVAVQEILFPMNSGSTISSFTLELRDDNNNELTTLEGSTTDFNVWIEVLERVA